MISQQSSKIEKGNLRAPRAHYLLSGCAIVGALLCSEPALAQSKPVVNHVTLAVGVVQFDLAGTGTAPLLALRDDFSFYRNVLVAELGVGMFRPNEDVPERSTYIIPDVQLQVQKPSGIVHPYVGVGAGLVYGSHGAQSHPGTLSASLGARVLPLGSRVGGRIELRVREIGRNAGSSTAEWTAGISIR